MPVAAEKSVAECPAMMTPESVPATPRGFCAGRDEVRLLPLVTAQMITASRRGEGQIHPRQIK
jgi:hypothetical protein